MHTNGEDRLWNLYLHTNFVQIRKTFCGWMDGHWDWLY